MPAEAAEEVVMADPVNVAALRAQTGDDYDQVHIDHEALAAMLAVAEAAHALMETRGLPHSRAFVAKALDAALARLDFGEPT